MPFKSQAQRRKFAELLVEGKISNETFEEWNRESGGRKLPERVGRKAAAAHEVNALLLEHLLAAETHPPPSLLTLARPPTTP
jgi:hypothetical protein